MSRYNHGNHRTRGRRKRGLITHETSHSLCKVSKIDTLGGRRSVVSSCHVVNIARSGPILPRRPTFDRILNTGLVLFFHSIFRGIPTAFMPGEPHLVP